jgi:DNA repair exonuclease SbcCD ATPase subunit
VENQELNKHIDQHKKDLVACRTMVEQLHRKMTKDQSRLEAIETDLRSATENQQMLAPLQRKARAWGYLYNMVSKDGLQCHLLSQLLDTISTQVTNRVQQFLPNKGVKLSMVTSKPSDKTGAVHHSVVFDFPLVNPDDTNTPSSCGIHGGMETFILNLVFKVVLAQITGFPRCSLLIVDEGLASFDQERLRNLGPMIEMFQCCYQNVLLITHSDGAQDSVDRQCTIEKSSDGGSKICISE